MSEENSVFIRLSSDKDVKRKKNMASKMFVDLPTGQKMPALGFGTWQASEEEIAQATEDALKAGYRHIDCAPVYKNEAAIGRVLKRWLDQGKLRRDELFIVTKLPPIGVCPGGPGKWIEKSLSDLQVDYLDVYLIHTPFTFECVNDDHRPLDDEGNFRLDKNTNHAQVWAEMEQQVEAGRTRAIGISNFNVKQINRILDNAKLPVSNLQIELHAYFQQKELVDFCKSKGIAITAYSPLGSRGLVNTLGKADSVPSILENEMIVEIAKKHKKQPAQVALRFIIQLGIAAIPKSVHADRINNNIDIFDFQLDEHDMKAIKRLDQGSHGRICDFAFMKGVQDHPEFPF